MNKIVGGLLLVLLALPASWARDNSVEDRSADEALLTWANPFPWQVGVAYQNHARPVDLSGASIASLTAIPCAQPHYYEVQARVPISGDAYPGAEALGDMVSAAPSRLRILCGHIHRPVQSTWNGRFAAIGGSPAFQIGLDLSGGAEEPPLVSENHSGCVLNTWFGVVVGGFEVSVHTRVTTTQAGTSSAAA